MQKRILNKILFLVCAIFLINFLAIKFYWYSSVWYFDMPMHFFGGVFVGLLVIYVFYMRRDDMLYVQFNKKIQIVLLWSLLISIGWEVFELLIDIFFTHNKQIIIDTISDLFFDLSGTSIALLYYGIVTYSHRDNT